MLSSTKGLGNGLDAELVGGFFANVILLLNAVHETTDSLIGTSQLFIAPSTVS